MSKKLAYGIFTGIVAVASIGITASLTTRGLATDSGAPTTKTSSDALLSDGGVIMDETIYSFLENNGNVRKTISSDWTQNDLGTDIFNKTEGKVSTPISYSINYYLNGEKIEANKLVGQSGHVKVRYEFKNNEIVDGMYTPYAVATGLVLSNDNFTNISVVNGKALNDGSRTALIGIAFPGLQEDLSISRDTLDIPNYFEFEADVKNFKLEMAMSFASSKVFSDIDTSALDKVDQLGSELSKVTDAMSQLINGSTQLSDGLGLLHDKSGALVSGIGQLNDGSKKLLDGTAQLRDGIKQAYTGVNEMAGKVKDANDKIQAYAKQLDGVKKNVAEMVTMTKKEVEEAEKTLDAIIAYFNAYQKDALANKISEQLGGQPVQIPTITKDNFATVITGITTNIPQAAIAANPELAHTLQALSGLNTTIESAKSTFTKVSARFEQIKQFATKLSQDFGGTEDLAATLDDKLADLNKLSDGVLQLKNGLKQLSDGSSALYDGMYSLDAGISTLNANTPALVDGITQLKDGSVALKDGLNAFNEQAIQKLVGVYQNDIQSLVSRLKKVVNLSKNAKANVKYIYRIEEVK